MNMSDPLGHVTDRLIAAYESIAVGGSAAVIVGATCVRRDGLINERMLGMYDDIYVFGHRDLVDVIRNNDSLSGIQLFYGGMIPGFGTTTPLDDARGWIPDTVSWGPSAATRIGNARPLVVPTNVYDGLVEVYAQAAQRSREAGYDFVSFHFCHGSLPHTNLSLIANVSRIDEYADHFRFREKIIERTQALCGKEFPIIPRLCCDENLQGGYDIEHFAEHFAPRLKALDIAVLDCTFGSMAVAPNRNPEIASTEFIGPSFYTPSAVNLGNIARLRQQLIAPHADMPLIGSANLGTPDHLRRMTDVNHADFAGVCRLSIDDPDYATKIYQSREGEIRKSTRTGASQVQGNIFGNEWAGSAQNPAFGRDREYRIRRTAQPMRVVVVGGGSGGMDYAITAKRIGHEVMLLERNDHLGGTMDWAGNYRNVRNMELLRYQPDYHRAMMARYDVPYRLGVNAGVSKILAGRPNVVVVATGARWALTDVPGLAAAEAAGFTVTLDRAMSRSAPFDPGTTPVIVGAAIGGELALDYAMAGLHPQLIDSGRSYIPANYLGSRAPRVEAALAKHDVRPRTGLALQRVGVGWIEVERAGEAERVDASSLILCPALAPANDLVGHLQGCDVVVQVIGDARKPRSIGNAIHEAAYLSRQICR